MKQKAMETRLIVRPLSGLPDPHPFLGGTHAGPGNPADMTSEKENAAADRAFRRGTGNAEEGDG